MPCDGGWHTSPACLSVGGGWDRRKRRSSWTTWKKCNLTPAFSLPSSLFTSQTHRGSGVTFFVPRSFFSSWSTDVRLRWLPTSCSPARSAWLLFSLGALELTGMPRLTAADICGSTGYCETWSHEGTTAATVSWALILTNCCTRDKASLRLCSPQVWAFVCR